MYPLVQYGPLSPAVVEIRYSKQLIHQSCVNCCDAPLVMQDKIPETFEVEII